MIIGNVKSASVFLLGLFGSHLTLIFLSLLIVCKMKWEEKEMSHCCGELSKTAFKVFIKEFIYYKSGKDAHNPWMQVTKTRRIEIGRLV